MKIRNALIVSLKFNPGHFSHLIASYKILESLGYTPYLYIDEKFNKMDEENLYRKVNSSSQLSELGDVDVSFFWFPSLKNIPEIFKLKRSSNSKIIYVYHEPFDSWLNYYNAGFGIVKIFRIWLINLVNLLILSLSNEVILPSPVSLKLYEKKYKRVNSHYSMVPLLFDDELGKPLTSDEKKFISYIGTVAADHAFDKFIAFVKAALTNDWLPDSRFLIATSSVIPLKLKAIIEPFIKSKRIIVFEGSYMSNGEINRHYQNSIVIWNAYHRSNQSGVLPKAYMFGAAVLVLNRNKSIFLEDNVTGILIESNDNLEEIKAGIIEILLNKADFSQKCRTKFLEMFYYKSYISFFKKLL
jgi:hypothetical protein